VDLNGAAWNRVDWNELAQEREDWQAQEREDWHALVKKQVNIRITKMGGIPSLTNK
jgi:hypothetical protein